MKKLFLIKFYFCLSSLALITGVHGQTLASTSPTLNSLRTTSAAKLSSNKFSAKGLSTFDKDFREVGEPNWSESNEGFAAYFSKSGIQSRVNYNKKGEWAGTIRYYGKDNLPVDIRQIVESDYEDYSIFNVTEVTIEDKTAYFVTLEDNKSF